MTFSESPMPGAFILDTPMPPKLDLSGARSQFYRSPQTPSAASSLCHSVGSDHQGSQGSRKRARHGYGYGYGDADVDATRGLGLGFFRERSTTNTTTSTWGNQSISRIASPAPLANADYRLAGGGVDTSTTSPFEKSVCDAENGPEVDYRPNRYRDSIHRTPLHSRLATGSPFAARDGNTRKRSRRESILQQPQEGSEADGSANGGGWGSAVIKIVGGVAVKVWDFCWSGPFRGFYAGGGKGYEMNSNSSEQQSPPQSLEGSSSWQNVYEKDDAYFPSSERQMDSTVAASGQFPGESRNQGSLRKENDELHGNWVMIKKNKENDARPEDHASPSSHFSPRKVPRHHPVAPRRIAAGRLAASRRQNLATAARPSSSSSSHHSHHHLSSKSGIHEPALSGSQSKYGSSPASLEAQRYAARAKRREREEDASIRRLNQQLKAMIKEGREALGTTIEIEDGMDMEDWD
ncbi:hypothetical protein AJ79_07288 [Helicocarpus griseus UAMH5409]|uniref:Uncharacterized protein n=1 Tax=Helicocarpus griseus UAMH5409 TaxID=1447875 RepID=A0A2B7X3S0_9EURO|nr:hypothetical protein AJ79_07288 [Helicocarpus griseus UAMH5409]